MPTRTEHISKAEENERAAATLAEHGHHGWAVTALFYAALHYVDACLDPTHPATHVTRRRFIAADTRFLEIREHYRRLSHHSREARYEAEIFTAGASEHRRVATFEPLRRVLRARLGL